MALPPSATKISNRMKTLATPMKTYMNNPRLKSVGVKMKFTPEQIQERILCSQDPIYFMEKYIKIVDVDEGLVPFKMYPFQKELVKSYMNNRFTLGCLARQLGKCFCINTIIKLKNKKTGQVKEMTVGEFFKMNQKNETE